MYGNDVTRTEQRARRKQVVKMARAGKSDAEICQVTNLSLVSVKMMRQAEGIYRPRRKPVLAGS